MRETSDDASGAIAEVDARVTNGLLFQTRIDAVRHRGTWDERRGRAGAGAGLGRCVAADVGDAQRRVLVQGIRPAAVQRLPVKVLMEPGRIAASTAVGFDCENSISN